MTFNFIQFSLKHVQPSLQRSSCCGPDSRKVAARCCTERLEPLLERMWAVSQNSCRVGVFVELWQELFGVAKPYPFFRWWCLFFFWGGDPSNSVENRSNCDMQVTNLWFEWHWSTIHASPNSNVLSSCLKSVVITVFHDIIIIIMNIKSLISVLISCDFTASDGFTLAKWASIRDISSSSSFVCLSMFWHRIQQWYAACVDLFFGISV